MILPEWVGERRFLVVTDEEKVAAAFWCREGAERCSERRMRRAHRIVDRQNPEDEDEE